MNIILVLIPLSIVLLIAAGWAFFWAVRNDQFEDLERHALEPLTEDPKRSEPVNAAAIDESDPPTGPAPPP